VRVLAVHDGRAGVAAQVLGLAQAMARGRDVEVVEATSMPSDVPDIAIGCGSKSRSILRALRKKGAFTVYVQDPRRRYSVYDVVVAPTHDGVERPNSIAMIGSPTRWTPGVLSEIAKGGDGFAAEKRAAFLIGGTSSRYEMDEACMEAHLGAAETLLEAGYGLMVTVSRRTPRDAAKSWRKLGAREDVWFYEGEGENPYGRFLATADVILVTEDSTNMLSEACGAGVPVYRLPMSGEPGKFARLYDDLEARCGVVRWPGELLELEAQKPLDETSRVAAEVWARFDAV